METRNVIIIFIKICKLVLYLINITFEKKKHIKKKNYFIINNIIKCLKSFFKK